MRRVVLLGAALATCGCSGGDETTNVTVTTTVAATTTTEATLPPRLRSYPTDGRLSVDEFNAYTERIDAPWEVDLEAIAAAFVEAGAVDASEISFASTVRGHEETATTSLTLSLADDAYPVRALRYVFELRRRTDGTWNVESANWSQGCRRGRGHQDFAPKPCG